MIALDLYETQINRYDLYSLLFGKRYDQPDQTEPSGAALADPLEKAEKSAQSLIKQRYGSMPDDTDFLNTVTVAGVIYLLSRKPHNQIDNEIIDQRRQTFFDMLPAAPGADSRAEVRSAKSKLGGWL